MKTPPTSTKAAGAATMRTSFGSRSDSRFAVAIPTISIKAYEMLPSESAVASLKPSECTTAVRLS